MCNPIPIARCALLLLTLCAAGLPAYPQQRVDITPLFGYRSPVSFPATAADNSLVTTDGATVRLAGSESFGAALGVRYDETAVIEFRFARQNTTTSFEGAGAFPDPLRNAPTRLEQYHGDFTREFPVPSDPRLRPFVIGSVGVTRFVWTGRTESRFSFGLGGGVKFFPWKWFGLRLQGQWLPIWVNPEVKGFLCGGGCLVVLGGRLASQFEFTVGPTFSF